MLKNLACALILTERDARGEENEPKVRGRIVTTVPKAKEVRPLVEKCITIAKRALPAIEKARELEPTSARGSESWRAWRNSEKWYEWNQTIAPAVAARRRCLKLLGDKQAVAVLFEEIAPRYVDRPGGYTRILKLATPRLGDAGARAILEFVGRNDRVKQASKPVFDDDEALEEETAVEEQAEAEDTVEEQEPAQGDAAEAQAEGDASEEASAEEGQAEEKPAE
ncbi:hypothetical protein JCM19992_08190 [Thermostilla marina]